MEGGAISYKLRESHLVEKRMIFDYWGAGEMLPIFRKQTILLVVKIKFVKFRGATIKSNAFLQSGPLIRPCTLCEFSSIK